MNTSTVENLGPALSDKSTKTGGVTPAVSNKATLTAAFPASPILGDAADYGKTVVAGMKFKLLTNTVDTADKADAQAYYGFSSVDSTEEIPSSGDLSFNGAPFVPGVKTDTDGNPIASPYMPNLVPPVHMNGAPDNPVPVVMTLDQAGAALTPGVGSGLISPKAASDALQAQINGLEDLDGPLAPSLPPGSNESPLTGP